MLGTQQPDPLLELLRTTAPLARGDEIRQEGGRGVVVPRALGGDQRVHLGPGGLGAGGERVQAPAADRRGLLMLRAPPFRLGAFPVGLARCPRFEELTDPSALAGRGGRRLAGGPELTAQPGAQVRLVADRQAPQQAVLLRLWPVEEPGGELRRAVTSPRGLRAGRRRGAQQVRIQPEEVGQPPLRAGQRTEPGRHRRFGVLLIQFTGLHAQQPGRADHRRPPPCAPARARRASLCRHVLRPGLKTRRVAR
ncbi:hypothetical protein [Crossiella sp. NPDC003009]